MSPEISERAFEEAIECALLRHGPDACPDDATAMQESALAYGDEPVPGGGYRKRRPGDYDRSLCLIPADVVDFLLAAQPKEWEKLTQHYGADVKPRFLGRLSREIGRRGALDILRNGVKDSGCKFRLAYFRPSSGLNEELQRLHAANLFSVVRQLRFSEHGEESLDLVLFLNGIPIFTSELKNPLNGQDIEDAIRQYQTRRDPREPLFAYGRCLAHFAIDPEMVFVTTRLVGPATLFLPFNQGRFGGAGNPPVPPTRPGFPTDYLWEQIWARDSVLDLVRQFIHEVEEEDDRGRKTGKRFLIFPRYQQLDCVRQLVRHARNHGTGERYLIQHSAGSGKSFTIAWLAHQLSVLHDSENRRIFDSVVVVTDRRVLDRQLQRTIRQFEQTLGVVENIDQTSRQLREALEAGRTLLVKPDRQIASAAQPFVVFRPVANVVLLLLRVLVLAALGILHGRTYLGHHHRRICSQPERCNNAVQDDEVLSSVSEPLWFRRRRPAILLRFLRLLQFPPPALGNRPYDTGRRSLWSSRTAHHRSAPDPSRSSTGSSRTLRSRNAATARFASAGLDQPTAGKNEAPRCRTSPSRGGVHTWGTPFFCFTQPDLGRC